MIICKRPDPSDDHLQESGPPSDHLQKAGSSRRSFAKGQILRMIICKRSAPPDDHLQQRHQEHQRHQQQQQQPITNTTTNNHNHDHCEMGQVDRSKALHEVLADLKTQVHRLQKSTPPQVVWSGQLSAMGTRGKEMSLSRILGSYYRLPKSDQYAVY